MTERNVIVIGAGLAGLYAAHLLRQNGIHALLIEARARLGGRIMTVDANGAASDDGFDLGPSWFWPDMQPDIAALVTELGLPAFRQHSAGDVVFERMSREQSQRYRGAGADTNSMRLAGGSAGLIHALTKTLAPGQIRLGARVTAMALHENGVELTLNGTETLRAAQVIAALPPRLLAGSITCTPAQEPSTLQRWRATPTWMAPHAKFIALYARPFWRDLGLSGTAQSMVGPLAEMHDATTASGMAALFGFVGISAEHRAAMGEAALTRASLAQLARIFGAEALAPQATLLKDWAADPLTATAADRGMGEHITPDRAPWVTGPWWSHLALAGTETSPTEPGYLSGAVVAARRAVSETLAKLTRGGSATANEPADHGET